MIRRILLLPFLLAAASLCSAHDCDSLVSSFIREHPRSMSLTCLKGETVTLCGGEDHLLIVLSLSDPELLMRFVMEGFSVFVDPTNRKREKHEFCISGASSLDFATIPRPKEEAAPPDSLERKPDIQPLLSHIRSRGVAYTIGKNEQPEADCCLSVTLDMEHDCLHYAILVPVAGVMAEKKLGPIWNIGISSEVGERPANPEGMMPPGPPREGEDEAKDILEWMSLSYEELLNMSL